ncbi:MAG: transcriptional regulator NrdR [Candidatus Fimenecus sp.]
MKCPKCGCEDSKVVDSRGTDDGERIRRRRECLNCAYRFTTYEIIESTPILVIKRDGVRESFDRQKVLNGMVKACEKRQISIERLEKAVDEIENEIRSTFKKEVPTASIGELTMGKLKEIDAVAYVRYASVYREFKDIQDFAKEISALN